MNSYTLNNYDDMSLEHSFQPDNQYICVKLRTNIHIVAAKEKEIIINRIKAVLAEKGVTQDTLAKHLGKAKTTISTYSTNTNQPSLHTLREIALYLKVDIRDLLVPTPAE